MAIERGEVERLREFIAAAKKPGNVPWALVESDVGNWLAEHGDDLLALLEAVQDAPVVRTNVTRINCCGGDPCGDPSGYCTDQCRRSTTTEIQVNEND